MTEAAPLLTGTAVHDDATSLEEQAKALLFAIIDNENRPGNGISLLPPTKQLAIILLAGSLRRIQNSESPNVLEAERFSHSVGNALWELCQPEYLQDVNMWADENQGMSTRSVSVMSLLAELEPDASARMILSHPAFIYAVQSAWRTGLSEPYTSATSYSVDKGSQPWLQHFWSLVAYLVLLCLSVSLAVAPVQPHEIIDARPYLVGREVAWMVLGWGHVAEVLFKQRRSSQLLYYLPTLIALSLVTLGQRPSIGASYSWICWSLPLLFTRLVMPLFPSLVLLDPTRQSLALPLAALLHKITRSTLQAAGLIGPVVLLVFATFSWALNGDVYRGLTTLLFGIMTAKAPPEIGVAPYEARAALAVTILLLLLLVLLLARARAVIPVDVDADDVWAVELGSKTAREAQQALITAILDSGVGLSVIAETTALQDTEHHYGSTSTNDDNVMPRTTLALNAPTLIPPINILGLVFASLPAMFIKTTGRDALLARRFERTVRWWLWRLTTGWISWGVVQISSLFPRAR